MSKSGTSVKFQSYCWCIGTTSFRVKDLGLKNENLLLLLNEFWAKRTGLEQEWNDESQEDFFQILVYNELAEQGAKNPAKDAREKTSALSALGLVDENRKITKVGQKLLKILEDEAFNSANQLGVDEDSLLYLEQLLKFRVNFENSFYKVALGRFSPVFLLINTLLDLEYLTYDEFTYVLPLLFYGSNNSALVKDLRDLRNNKKSIDAILINNIIKLQSNYQDAFKNFLTPTRLSAQDFSAAIMSRKGTSYDHKFVTLFSEMSEILDNPTSKKIEALWEKTSCLCQERHKIFKPLRLVDLRKTKGIENIFQDEFLHLGSEQEIRKFFFKIVHLARIKATLKDYSDLNRRYLSLSDIFSFEDERVSLTLPSKLWFQVIRKNNGREGWLIESCASKLREITPIRALIKGVPTTEELIGHAAKELGTKVRNTQDLFNIYSAKRRESFEKLIETKFQRNKLIEILTFFENDERDKIFKAVTDKADFPTIFEYVLGICWHWVNGRSGDLRSSLHLTLDADNYPKTHALGGLPDLLFKYSSTNNYVEHSLLLEATLSDGTNQRRMEMEPVSRHLFKQIETSKNNSDYAIFIAPTLHPSVVCDFRSRKNAEMTMDYKNYVDGMKIIPLTTELLKNILRKEMVYEEIFGILEAAHQSDLKIKERWFQTMVESKLS